MILFPPAVLARIRNEMLQHKHPDDIEVIEHPNYGPRVKLKCRICWEETYVRTTPDEEQENG